MNDNEPHTVDSAARQMLAAAHTLLNSVFSGCVLMGMMQSDEDKATHAVRTLEALGEDGSGLTSMLTSYETLAVSLNAASPDAPPIPPLCIMIGGAPS